MTDDDRAIDTGEKLREARGDLSTTTGGGPEVARQASPELSRGREQAGPGRHRAAATAVPDGDATVGSATFCACRRS